MFTLRVPLALIIATLAMNSATTCQAQWKPAPGPLATRWTKEVTPETAHREYPRPQLIRQHWTNLNGLWDYAIVPNQMEISEARDRGKILVPFPLESSLSGVMRSLQSNERLIYEREIEIPKRGEGDRVLLHFGAVDWKTRVVVNGQEVGTHVGGYDPFSFDITGALDTRKPRQQLVVDVVDPTDAGFQPRGKQVQIPESIWYTPTSGIWQTVWLEVVPATYISKITPTADIDRSSVRFEVELATNPVSSAVEQAGTVEVIVFDGKQEVARARGVAGKPLDIELPAVKLWSPAAPHLYDIKAAYYSATTLEVDAKPSDDVRSYFAMRKISIGNDKQGALRILLNNKFLFQSGTLDQGFWPDGLYTAPTDAAMRYDLETTKKLGFNMVRKHVKVEPARWYRYCDEMGLLVWQDMPSGDRYIGPNDADIARSDVSAENYLTEWSEIVNDLRFFSSIVVWVPFNEGWGQFDTANITDCTRKLDSTRLIDSVSGWADRNVGDMHDVHVYPGPGAPPQNKTRALVLGEFGGLGLPIEHHTWQAKHNWSYRSYTSDAELNLAFLALYDRLPELIDGGLSASVYTQTTDVEIEVNGLLTYDRDVIKIDPEVAQRAHALLGRRIVKVDEVIETAEKSELAWNYTFKQPPQEWNSPNFDDARWSSGKAGFGQRATPASVVRTEWTTDDIWLRRTVTIPKRTWHHAMLRAHWDEDTTVYFNGQLAAQMSGYSTQYGRVSLTKAGEEQLAAGGELVIAVHTHQTGGGQYIDLGICDVVEQARD